MDDLADQQDTAAPLRPVARYVVADEGGFYWLWRLSPTGDKKISPYVNLDAALDCAAHLNTHVRWEAPNP